MNGWQQVSADDGQLAELREQIMQVLPPIEGRYLAGVMVVTVWAANDEPTAPLGIANLFWPQERAKLLVEVAHRCVVPPELT